jgi:putative ABC transport system substrate-binding protein
MVDVRPGDSLDGAFEAMVRGRAGALLALPGAPFFRDRKRLADLALQHRLPAIFELGEFADAGGLMAYAPDLAEMYRGAAVYVDKILRGARPADLPVEQPTRLELVINLATAKLLGVTVPESVLLRRPADSVTA